MTLWFFTIALRECRLDEWRDPCMNDWANAGVAMTVSEAKVVKNFFMLFLLCLRFHERRLQSTLDYSAS
jgi:hypothetical protein